jgi:hypothetical protein
MKRGKRCVSGCKGLQEEICTKSPRCTYFTGKKSYCRLSHKFKMTPNCHVRTRMTRKNKLHVARERIKQFVRGVNSISPNKVHAHKYRESFPSDPSEEPLSDELNRLMVKEPRQSSGS